MSSIFSFLGYRNHLFSPDEAKEISPSGLEKKRLSLEQDDYLKFLKKMSVKAEAQIMINATTTGIRDAELEDKLKLLQAEMAKFGGSQPKA